MAEVNPTIQGASGKTRGATAAVNTDGTLTGGSQDVGQYVASAAIVRGEPVILVGPTATAEVTVARIPVVGTLSGASVVGVALNDATAGQVVKVARDYGWVRTAATVGQGVLQSATAGVAAGAAIASTANTQFGVALSASTAGVFPSVTTPATNATTTGVFVKFGTL